MKNNSQYLFIYSLIFHFKIYSMSKFLIKAAYTAEGIKGLLKEGGSKRKSTVEKLVKSLGGKVEVFYYAFGEYDAYVILDLPDLATATALSLTINATGLVT